MLASFSSVKLENSGVTIENIDHCHHNLLMYKYLTSTDEEYESGFVGDQYDRDSELKRSHAGAETVICL